MSEIHRQLERLLEVGRVREAQQLLHTGLTQEPGDPELRVYAARVAMADDDLDEARLQVEQALRTAPHHFMARVVLFDLEMEANAYAQAEQVVTGLIRDNPANAPLLALYARLMLQTFHLEKSRALVNEALRRDPDDETARLVDVILSTVEGNAERADVQLSDLVAEDPHNEQIVRTLLVTLADRGRNREALLLAQQLLRVHPDDDDLLELLVVLRVQTHPLSLPLLPMQKFGWAGSAGIWFGAVVLLNFMRSTENAWVVVVGVGYLLWVVYTWAYPPVMTRWVRARGM